MPGLSDVTHLPTPTASSFGDHTVQMSSFMNIPTPLIRCATVIQQVFCIRNELISAALVLRPQHYCSCLLNCCFHTWYPSFLPLLEAVCRSKKSCGAPQDTGIEIVQQVAFMFPPQDAGITCWLAVHAYVVLRVSISESWLPVVIRRCYYSIQNHVRITELIFHSLIYSCLRRPQTPHHWHRNRLSLALESRI